jgi:microcystin degradation protein MlrC
MPRIAIGQVSHETNTFSPPTTLEMFKTGHWDHGEAILARERGTRTYLGGMIDAAERLGITAVPTFSTTTEPWGTITREAYEAIVAELLRDIRAAMPVDAVCLALHGAAIAEWHSDVESDVLAAVREAVGPEIPIAVTLDLHGNISPRMLRVATGLFGVHQYPHTDEYERGEEAIGFLLRVLRRDITPAMAIETLPLLIPASPSALEPVRSINASCHRWEHEHGMVDCAFFHGFSHTDLPDAGVTVVATAERDPALARRAARAVAEEIWARREAFHAALPQAAEAVAEAVRLTKAGNGQRGRTAAGTAPADDAGGPVVINETSDNPGGGAPGDGTHLLRAMLDARLTDSVFGTMFDPEVADAAHRAGVGAEIRVRLGGKHDRLHGAPLDLEVYVRSLTDGRFRLTTPMGQGAPMDLGRMALLQCGGLGIVVASRRTQVLDREPFLLHGIDVTRCRIIGLKSSAHFRAGFTSIARAIVTADPPGITTANLFNLPYRRLRRPIYPFDADAVYRPSASS